MVQLLLIGFLKLYVVGTKHIVEANKKSICTQGVSSKLFSNKMIFTLD